MFQMCGGFAGFERAMIVDHQRWAQEGQGSRQGPGSSHDRRRHAGGHQGEVGSGRVQRIKLKLNACFLLTINLSTA
jgi:hypothetical protein